MSTTTWMQDFFVAGGTLHSDAPSYVKRPADDELFDLTLAGEFCYVLTPRQMGKSSLMVHTASRLEECNVRTAIIDLTSIGIDVSVEQWYMGLITRLKARLKLSLDVDTWWAERASLSTVQRLTDFLHDVVLAQIESRVVIFVDEIDATLNLFFSDDFFAAIRFAYNARATDPAYNRLTFVLLGVAAPADLIKDPQRTPFNIGHIVDLGEFDQKDACVLEQGLEAACAGQGTALFARIFYWTNGHPYLTQKLCRAVVERGCASWSDAQIDELVQSLFLSKEARKEVNLQFIRGRILAYPQRRQLFALYCQVYRGKRITDDERSLAQNQLKLLGLVQMGNGYLRIRNEIYRHAFDLAWVRENTPVSWAPVVTSIAVAVALLAVGFVVYNMWVENQVKCLEDFSTDTPKKQLACLAKAFGTRTLFNPAGYDFRARELFYALPTSEEQLALFKTSDVKDTDLVVVIQGLYVTLADVGNTDSTTPLLKVMADALRAREKTKDEIVFWQEGREYAKQGNYDDAYAAYEEAIKLKGDNPATRYERARVIVIGRQQDYSVALADLDQVMAIAQKSSASTTTPPSRRIIITNTVTSNPNQTLFPTLLPTKSTPDQPSDLGGGTSPGSATAPMTSPSSKVTSIPTPTPALTPMPPSKLKPIKSEFSSYDQIVSAVRNLIYGNPKLVSFLSSAPSSEYPNLQKFRASGLSADACTPEYESLLPASLTFVSKIALSSTDAFQCIMFYSFDHASNGRVTFPVSALVYRTDRSHPVDINAYPLNLPDGSFLGVHIVTAYITNAISTLPDRVLVIQDTDEHGVVVEATIFSWEEKGNSEESAYKSRGSFTSEGGVKVEPDKVTVFVPRSGTRSRLADRKVYRPRQLDKKSYYPKNKEGEEDTSRLVDPETIDLVSLDMPPDPATAEYPEKLLLGFYASLPSIGTDQKGWMTQAALDSFAARDSTAFGCLVDSQLSQVFVEDMDLSQAPGILPHLQNDNPVITGTITVTSLCRFYTDSKKPDKKSIIIWQVRWDKNTGRWVLLKPTVKP